VAEETFHGLLDEDEALALQLQQQYDSEYATLMNMSMTRETAAAAAGGGGSVSQTHISSTRSLDHRTTEVYSQAAMTSSGGACRQPLLPGVYHIVSRDWLKKWRNWLKGRVDTSNNNNSNNNSNNNKSSGSLPLLDCTHFLCHTHGNLIVPPHLDEYLRGFRKSLLAGLAQYPGEVSHDCSPYSLVT
jgi:hypothetical protein